MERTSILLTSRKEATCGMLSLQILVWILPDRAMFTGHCRSQPPCRGYPVPGAFITYLSWRAIL
jgi:hypothetical protein